MLQGTVLVEVRLHWYELRLHYHDPTLQHEDAVNRVMKPTTAFRIETILKLILHTLS
jgi:hypothetical protein